MVKRAPILKRYAAGILERFPRLVFVGNTFYVTPIRHVFRAVPLQPTIRGSGFCATTELVTVAGECGATGWGYLIHKSGYVPKRNFWAWENETLPHALHEAIIAESLPFLLPLDDFEACRQAFIDEYEVSQGAYDWVLAYFHLCAGEFAAAHQLVSKFGGRTSAGEIVLERFGPLGLALIERGDRLTGEEKRIVIAMLHEQEARAIRNYKLEKYWQPSPFPAEEKGLV
jgi:hypothetical protein